MKSKIKVSPHSPIMIKGFKEEWIDLLKPIKMRFVKDIVIINPRYELGK